jgi:CubicO group peptidase (beta-lactamase class C family)
MLLLHEQGELSLDDEIHTFFLEFKDFGYPVTIRQLIHQTSGFRSLHPLVTMADWRSKDKRTNENLMRLMLRQEELNFRPGDEYLYCNTGYILMAEIVERVSGQGFTGWINMYLEKFA